jgi:hypothetical protein
MILTKPDIVRSKFSHGLKIMLRSYTRAINNQENRTGSLFQQNTKIKSLENGRGKNSDDHPFTCFHYIHQNPMKAGLVSRMEEWEMSSFIDFLNPNSDSICNRSLAYDFLEVPKSSDDFLEQSYKVHLLDSQINSL